GETCRGGDTDGDGLEGCDDPDCWARCTPDCPPGASCPENAPRCGDGTCNLLLEDCHLCPLDCACTPRCGDSYCDPPENHATCPGDCPVAPCHHGVRDELGRSWREPTLRWHARSCA